MIQILGMRSWFDNKVGKEKKKDEFFQKNWRAVSIKDLLENHAAYLAKIPELDRWNIHFTQFECGSKKREFKEQWVIPFDIDHVDLGRVNENQSEARLLIAQMKGKAPEPNPYIKVFCDTLGLNPSDIAVILSGHGLHIIVQLKEPFTSTSYFEQKRPFYNAICDKLNLSLAKANLPGALDRQMWSPGQMGFRMPGTENRKEGRPPVEVRLLQGNLNPVDFDFAQLSGLPEIEPEDQIKTAFKGAPADTNAVLSGCNFLKHCKENPGAVHDPEWFAMLGIVGRLKDGSKLAHEYSQGHPGYHPDETETKLTHALTHSGPRTCQAINKLPNWNKCQECPHFEKVKSPINIRSEDYLETEGTGFHKVTFDKSGNPVTGKPSFEDLRKFFDRKYHYRVMGESGICYVWTGTHYEWMKGPYIKEFAQTHFSPPASKTMREEFRDLICSTNLTEPQWFVKSTEKKINFKNGVFDLRTGDLGPHDRENGFRYVLPYDYDPYATCPTFDKFIRECMDGDQDLINLLMEFAGYSFSNDFPKQGKTLVLTGIGSNGKSTFIDVLKALAGKTNYSSLDWKSIRNETFRQAMDGKLFNLSEESPKDALRDSAFFKNIITGGEMLINVKYQQPYSIPNYAKLIWACNAMPESEDTTVGFFRRFLIVPWTRNFTDELGNDDKNLRDKLFLELSGIFNLVKAGHDRLTRSGRFTDASASKEELQKYKDEIDHASRWIKDNVIWTHLNGGSKWAVIPEMYQSYRMEMLTSGMDPVNAINFGKKLSLIIPEYEDRLKQKKHQGKNSRVLLDCTYNSDEIM